MYLYLILPIAINDILLKIYDIHTNYMLQSDTNYNMYDVVEFYEVLDESTMEATGEYIFADDDEELPLNRPNRKIKGKIELKSSLLED